MDIKKAKSIIKSLENIGFKVSLRFFDENRPVVSIDTDYYGPYPGKYQFDTLEAMRRKYGKKYTVAQRGHYTAVFIY